MDGRLSQPPVWQGNEDCAGLLLQHGASTTSKRPQEYCPLNLAVYSAHLGIMHMLDVHDPSSLDYIDGYGNSALDVASRLCNDIHLAKTGAKALGWLLIYGADPLVEDRKGETPLAVLERKSRGRHKSGEDLAIHEVLSDATHRAMRKKGAR